MNISRQRTSTVYITAALAILVIAFMPGAFHPARSATPSQTGLLIPLYAYPTDSSWSGLIHAKEAYPNVPVIAVIDPSSSGPGSYDSNFASGVAKLQDAGITVVGYIDTEYGSLSMSTLESWISDYASWYNVNGVFFDSMSNSNGEASYYSTASSYASSVGMSLTVGNPGTSVPSNYVGSTNIIVIYENGGIPSVSTLSSSTFGDSPSGFGMIAYSVSEPSQSFLSSVAQYTGWVYFTDAGSGDPYQSLPSYLTSLMSMLSSMDSNGNGGITTSTTASTTSTSTTTSRTRTTTSTTTTTSSNPPTTTTTSSSNGGTSVLTVDSENTLGNPVSSYYTELYASGGGTSGTGYTPSTYTLNNGVGYQIEADGYGPCTFSYWSGGGFTGSTQDPAPISINGPTTIYAVYSGSSCGSQTSSTTTSSSTTTPATTTSTTRTTSTRSTTSTTTATASSPPTTTSTTTTPSVSGGPVSLIVESVDQNGNSITGYYATLRSSSGKQISTGYTDTTFTNVNAGTEYQIELDGYGSCQFQYWQGTGSTTDPLPFTQPNGALTVVGVYDCSSRGSVGGPAFIGAAISAAVSEFGMSITLIALAFGSLLVVRGKALGLSRQSTIRP
jgi:hypothetical protein